MGRLDDHAKRRIVELRRAGLSFRKIKKVLELDDIRVTPQAVYLFLKRKSVEPGSAAAGWDGDQPWPPLRGCEAEPPKPPGARPPAMPSGGPAGSQDTKEGIQIVSVASLCKDGGQLGEALPMGPPSGNGDDGSAGTPSASGGPATPPQHLPSQERLVTPPTRSPALMVKKMIVDRALLPQKKQALTSGGFIDGQCCCSTEDGRTLVPAFLAMASSIQNKAVSQTELSSMALSLLRHSKRLLQPTQVKDASTQTALPNPLSPGNQNLAWGGPVLPPAPSSRAIAEKLDAVQTEIQKLSQALHMVLERQCHLERQQEHQQRLQQEVLMTLQQLSSTVSHGTVPANQPCAPFSSMAEPSPTVPNFSQFKMELI
ncbi:uncharacterized protein ACIBXB_004593 isoform 1-T3 [Morphnus guianensis]